MNTVLTEIAQMRRPKLLNDAARVASRSYKRRSDLPKILTRLDVQVEIHKDMNSSAQLTPVLRQLVNHENDINEQRLKEREFYQPAAHIAVLAAIIAESQALQKILLDQSERQRVTDRNAIPPSIQMQHMAHRQHLEQHYTNVSGIAAFLSTRKASRASEMAGSIPGC